MPASQITIPEVELREQILTLRGAGLTFDAISARLNVSKASCVRRYNAMRAEAIAAHREHVDEHREDLDNTYRLVVRTMMDEMVRTRGTPLCVNAANAVLRALRQLADLHGLNVPVVRRVQADIRTVDDAELLVTQIERWLAESDQAEKIEPDA
jgi:DNA-binding transcriptional MerR regulator